MDGHERSGEHPTLVLVTGMAGTGKSILAEVAADTLRAPVLAWDWVMASLTRFEAIQRTFRRGSRDEYVAVGWAVLCDLATAELRRGRSVVLDGLAREPEVAAVRQVAADTGAALILVATDCSDPETHRRLVEGRRRGILGWHELEWSTVSAARDRWSTPDEADLHLDAVDPLEANVDRLRDLLQAGI